MDNQQNNQTGSQQYGNQQTGNQQQYQQYGNQQTGNQQQYGNQQYQQTGNQQQYRNPQQVVPQQQPQPIINQQNPQQPPFRNYETIYCSTCGQQIAKVAMACPFCGAPVYQNQPQQQPQQIIINNNNANNNNVHAGAVYAGRMGQPKNKWIALLLWLFLGLVGGHKFYEGKILMGIVYIFTAGLFGIGLFIDFFAILFKPNPYYV